MSQIRALFASVMCCLSMAAVLPANAQDSAAQILEKARAQAREIEELRAILTGADQNMRLATFDTMIKSGDEAMRLVAYEAGLASADSVMRAMAFKAAVMNLDTLHLELAPDPSAPRPIVEASTAYLAKNGNALLIGLGKRDPAAGTFRSNSWAGQVSGMEFMLNYGGNNAQLTLKDDNALAGVVRLDKGSTRFLATARLR